MKIYLIVLPLLLTACGADTKQLEDAYAAQAVSGGVQNQPENPREVVIEYRKDGDKTALVVGETSELPACSNANIGQLVYVKAEAKYFNCAAPAWQERAEEKAVVAETAAKPAAEEVKAVEAVKAPENSKIYSSVNTWVDPQTGRQWTYAGARSALEMGRYPACGNGWQLPDRNQAGEAIRNGLLVATRALSETMGLRAIWTRDFLPIMFNGIAVNGRVGVDADGLEQTDSTLLPLVGPACFKD